MVVKEHSVQHLASAGGSTDTGSKTAEYLEGRLSTAYKTLCMFHILSVPKCMYTMSFCKILLFTALYILSLHCLHSLEITHPIYLHQAALEHTALPIQK